jgi:hypothetical protein
MIQSVSQSVTQSVTTSHENGTRVRGLLIQCEKRQTCRTIYQNKLCCEAHINVRRNHVLRACITSTFLIEYNCTSNYVRFQIMLSIRLASFDINYTNFHYFINPLLGRTCHEISLKLNLCDKKNWKLIVILSSDAFSVYTFY